MGLILFYMVNYSETNRRKANEKKKKNKSERCGCGGSPRAI